MIILHYYLQFTPKKIHFHMFKVFSSLRRRVNNPLTDIYDNFEPFGSILYLLAAFLSLMLKVCDWFSEIEFLYEQCRLPGLVPNTTETFIIITTGKFAALVGHVPYVT